MYTHLIETLNMSPKFAGFVFVYWCLTPFLTIFRVLLAEETEGSGKNHFCAYLAVIHSNVIMCPFYVYIFPTKHMFL